MTCERIGCNYFQWFDDALNRLDLGHQVVGALAVELVITGLMHAHGITPLAALKVVMERGS
ncbi:hypothetical protein BVC80_7721g5 [Macleaya cordata]|uniref:Uncharacterized protein n=1 Tax=Macleaya cordata TaxID=56857 RepID=A0A200Q1B7_MACCD|nr:hypothetical protein BVC80_7721g5 [Macleaya cordata]